jgi:hypothetical protein
MKFVEEVVEKLLAVLMVVSSELGVSLQNAENVSRLQSPFVGSVEIFDELAEGTSHMAVAAEDVSHVEVFKMSISYEIFSEICQSHQALQGRIHVARISQVLEAYLAYQMQIFELGEGALSHLEVLDHQVELPGFCLKGIALFFVVFLGFSAFGTAEEDAAALAGSEVLSRTAVQAFLSHCYHFKRGNFRENTSLLAEV